MRKILFFGFLLYNLIIQAQFAPPAEQEGTTAIEADSDIFVAWAEEGIVQQSWMDISDTLLGKVSYGEVENIFGLADNNTISLGDGGFAKIHFSTPLINEEGFDFAVFENSFSDDFLELAFVEVSSDGENFFRFPAVSNTQVDTQIATFGTIDATKIHNLAGKYRAMFGTPFDLEDLSGIQGLDINQITDMKIIDVIGSINPDVASYDSQNQIVNDPYPTSFASGGFDLDAIGVIHDTEHNVVIIEEDMNLIISPNPFSNMLYIKKIPKDIQEIEIFSPEGVIITSCLIGKDPNIQINLSKWTKGVYFVKFNGKHSFVRKILKI